MRRNAISIGLVLLLAAFTLSPATSAAAVSAPRAAAVSQAATAARLLPTSHVPWGGCTLTVAAPQRLTYYIHAWATLKCIGNAPGGITIDLGYDTWYGGHSVQRENRSVPADVNQSFGLLYTCPGGTGGTLRTWSMDALAHVGFYRNGVLYTATYSKTGPKATFRC